MRAMRDIGKTVAVFAAYALLCIGQPATAQDFYKGKTLSIIVGNSAGGGHDAYARLLARHYARYIAGNPNIIVQNMPGAATLKSVQYLDVGSPKDGTVMTTFAPDLVTQALLEPETLKVDFTQFSWVGSMTRDFRACYATEASGVKSWDDLVKHPKFNVGSGAVGSSSYINGAILIQLFGVKINQVLGYPGSSEIRLALERGELDGACGSWSSVPTNWIEERKINPLVRFSALDLPGAAGVPYVVDLAASASEKRALNLLLAAGEVARPYIMSRAVPADRLAVLRKAFDATMGDPQFLDDADKQKLPVMPISGVEAAALIAGIYASSPAEVSAAREAIR
jgi:tripartite-type tricarboxylate transporter receptor subunit TctC